MSVNKIDYKIHTKVFDELAEHRETLPDRSGRSENSYDYPAGLALLACKDNMVDMVVPLRRSGGCYDAPNVSFRNMDVGMRKVLKEDRQVVGMALVRHKKWYPTFSNSEGKISNDLVRNIHDFKNSFADITKTIWIVLHNDTFKTYSVSKDESKRLVINETKARGLYHDEKGKFFAGKIKREKQLRKAEADKKKKEARRQKERKEARERAKDAALRKLNAKSVINKAIDEKKQETIDVGGGFVMLKQTNGEYMLWQTGR